MSDTEHKKGILKPTGLTLDEFISDVQINDYYKSKKEYFDDLFYRKAYLISGLVYEVNENIFYDDSDIYEASLTESGEIEFEIKFYNGGCSHSEAIDTALRKIELAID